MSRIGGFSAGNYRAQADAEQLATLRSGLGDLNRQLATGRRAETLAGYGPERATALAMRAHADRTAALQETATRGRQRLALMTGALGRFDELARAGKSDAALAGQVATTSGVTSAAIAARGRLGEALGVLNGEFDGQYLFSGRASDREPVPGLTAMLDGEGGAAGLKTLIAERRAADRGSGLGRLASSIAGSTVSLAQEAPGLPFGFTLGALRSGLTGATATGPGGAPAAVSVAFAALPQEGEAFALDLTLPDGTSETVTLAAKSGGIAAGEVAFAIGSDGATTAANFRAALEAALGRVADRALAAASAIVAASDFTSGSSTSPARRISGPPFDTAIGYAPAGARATVTFYRGDDAAGQDARTAQVATVDTGLSLGVGARADEPALKSAITGFAALAAETASPGDNAATGRYAALAGRVSSLLDGAGGQKIQDISTDLAMASATMEKARQRHALRRAFQDSIIDGIERPSVEELSASILGLQTRLQASYQVTANLGRLSLTDYLR